MIELDTRKVHTPSLRIASVQPDFRVKAMGVATILKSDGDFDRSK